MAYPLGFPRISDIHILWQVSTCLDGYPPADSGYPQWVQSGHLYLKQRNKAENEVKKDSRRCSRGLGKGKCNQCFLMG
jgi:hypothetical protein